MKSKKTKTEEIEKSTFLRLDGILYENNTFEAKPGWETDRVIHRHQEGDGTYTVILKDKEGAELISTSPKVDFEDGCSRHNDQMRSIRLVAYVPRHPDAVQIALCCKGRTLHEALVEQSPPEVVLEQVKYNRKELSADVSWKVSSDKKKNIRARVFYFTSTGRGFPVSHWTKNKSKLSVDLGSVPADAKATIGILVSDGVRSATVVSKEFKSVDNGPTVIINSPEDGRTYPHGHPIDLLGQINDAAGAPIKSEVSEWSLNGESVCMESSQGMLSDLEPGKYEVELKYKLGKRQTSEAKVEFEVAPRCEKHSEAFSKLVEKINESVIIDPTVHEGSEPRAYTPGSNVKPKCNCH